MTKTFSNTSSDDPGHFRIGFVILQIPPTDISTNKVINDDQVSTLRGSSPMFIKTGQARWDVTVNWKVVRYINIDGTYDYSQWEDLQRIIAIFKAAPFVEVENAFLRQHFSTIQPQYQTQRMAFALKQLRIDTNPDSNNVIDVVLTMSLFNYSPYTKDFGYVGPRVGQSVDATNSIAFESFITNWIAENINKHPASFSSPPMMDWKQQDEGVVSFKWRKYIYVPFKTTLPSPVSNASAGYSVLQPPPTVSRRVTVRKLSDDIQTIINNAAKRYGLDPAIVTALCLLESRGDPNANRGVPGVGHGLLQIVDTTAAQLGITNTWDPVQNADGGCRYLAQLLKEFKNYPQALGAYNVGPGNVIAYRDGVSLDHGKINPQRIKTSDGLPPAGIPNNRENTPLYVATIMTNAGRAADLHINPVKSVDHLSPATPTSSTALDIPNKDLLQAVTDAIKELPQTESWWLDHFTERGAHFYAEEQITLASADSSITGDYNMFPNQISIVMVNNLPVIPLAAFQYPTYQHVGPTDTIISIGFNSVGIDDGTLTEPEHQGIQALASMSSQLEDQFHNLRTTVRAVSSIHRMQAVFIENQILNLLGIQGTMIRGLNTETVPDSTGLAQVAIMASQYENIFEDTSPYRINGVAGAYNPIIKNILTTGQLNNVSKEEQQATVLAKNFADSWKKKDPKFLLDEILSISKQPIDFLSSVATPDAKLRPDQKLVLLAALDLLETGKNLSASELISGAFNELAGNAKFQRDTYPGLQQRRLTLQNATIPMTYADYFVFTQLPEMADQATIASIRKTTEAVFSSQRSDILDVIYSKLFDYEVLTNPLFSREITTITNSPTFKKLFTAAVSIDGVAQQPENAGHGCYKDLGLNDYAEDPASYFIDYNEVINSDTADGITKVLGTANQTANDVNAIQSVSGKPGGTPDSSGLTFTAHGQDLPGAGSALVRMMKIPAYSMATAYPTFKLLLIEEDNTGPFFAFDNFYSYASIIDIEVIKYRDKPDTAIIQITNLAHLLQHRLYDDTAAGKMEALADKFNVDPSGALTVGGSGVSPNGVTTGGNPTSGLVASKTASGQPYQLRPRKNMAEGMGETYSRIPLKYFALQTGSKIQVRLGFSNNPDGLYPVFTGQVTDIEGDEILTLTCQSFQLELMSVPGTTVKKDSSFGFNFLPGGSAFGGISVSSSGDSSSIMKKMLSAPAARHFGHWQVNGIPDKMLKGFTWTEPLGQALQTSSNKTLNSVGALLQTGYDRSEENILVNSVINIDASKTAQDSANKGRRKFDDENPNWFLGTASYSIPQNSTASIWDVIKDISRRYPHYNLMIRDYGYPYAADATLVFAHPLDWYYYRPKLFGDSEREKPNNVTQQQLFQRWWSADGKKKWDIIWSDAINGPSLNIIKNLQTLAAAPLIAELSAAEDPATKLAGQGPEEFNKSITSLHGMLSGTRSMTSSGINNFLNSIANIGTDILNSGNITGKFFLGLDANFQDLYREWLVYLQVNEPAANSSRLKPVRKYHLIDQSHIVHNGIVVNDKMYNAVKIKDEAAVFNQNIPPQHIRMLDVTDSIINPDDNCLKGIGNNLVNAYAQSFLRDEVGKMYTGELILRGVPEIEPFDVILLSDPSTGTVGPIEVESVIHSFNLENGYITIVKPRLLVLTNESVSIGLVQSLAFAWSTGLANLHDVGTIFNPFNANTTVSARAIEVGAIAGIGLATAAAFAWAPPVGIVLATLSLTAYGVLVYAENRNKQNFFQIMPLSRFNRPWLGGLQGFEISNFAYSLGQTFKWFDAEEISPTIESWNELMNYRNDYLLQQ